MVTVTAARITGTVFEDVNYGGGAGRSRAAAGGVGRPGARVELYAAAGAFLWPPPTTGPTGVYTLRRLGRGRLHGARGERHGVLARGRAR